MSGDVAHVLVLGMGGSVIAGDVVAAVAAPFLPVPVQVVKDYELPGCAGPDSLVLAVSFSGSSENQRCASDTERAVASAMSAMATFTASASGFSRLPPQAAQGVSLMKRPISSRTASESLSL